MCFSSVSNGVCCSSVTVSIGLTCTGSLQTEVHGLASSIIKSFSVVYVATAIGDEPCFCDRAFDGILPTGETGEKKKNLLNPGVLVSLCEWVSNEKQSRRHIWLIARHGRGTEQLEEQWE